MTDLYKKINELDAKYGYDFEGELYKHLKNKFPKEYKLTVEAKKKKNQMKIQKHLHQVEW